MLRESLGMICLGVGLGAAAAWAAGRVLQHTVEGIEPAGPSTFAVTIPMLVAAALLASFLPARVQPARPQRRPEAGINGRPVGPWPHCGRMVFR